jgi:hypothetical protein
MKHPWTVRVARRLAALPALVPGLGLAGLALAGLAHPAPSVAAEPPRAVVELFTSQGCSSCPPADALIGELAKERDLVVMTMPVDYWDYLGWKDTLADPAFTARQKGYAKARGDGQVYTPQVVVNGGSHAVGSDRSAIEAATKAQPARLERSRVGGGGRRQGVGLWSARPAPPAAPRCGSVRFAKKRTVAIGRGENSGRTVTYSECHAQHDQARRMGRRSVDARCAARGPSPKEPTATSWCCKRPTRQQAGPIVGAAKGPGL